MYLNNFEFPKNTGFPKFFFKNMRKYTRKASKASSITYLFSLSSFTEI